MKRFTGLAERIFYFIRKKKNWVYFFLGTVDILALTVAFQISFWLFNEMKHTFFFTSNVYSILYLCLIPAWMLMMQATNVSRIPRTGKQNHLFFVFFQFSIFNMIFLYVLYYVLNLSFLSHLFIIVDSMIGFVILFAIRSTEYHIFRWYRKHGHNCLNITLIADDSAREFIEDLLNRKDWGYKILYVFSDSKLLRAEFGNKLKFLPESALDTLHKVMEFEIIDEVIYYKYNADTALIREKIRSCEEIGITFRFRSEIEPLYFTNGHESKVGNVDFLTFINVPTNSLWLAFKTTLDIYVSFILIILASPVFISLAIIIKVTSPGPIIFKQARVGLRGRQFYILKFRTMVVNAESLRSQLEKENEMDGPVFKIKKDPRITKIGGILRKTGLDELPQLFNVLRGEMSLIGPRPPLQSETNQYERWQLRRLSVKPGITCSWQISPDRNNIKFEKWMELDLDYIDNWSPKLDILLLIKTFRTVVFKTGA